MAISADRGRVSQGISHCLEAREALLAASATLSGLDDESVHAVVLGCLESVARLEARLQLLSQAYTIAESNWLPELGLPDGAAAALPAPAS